VTTRKLVTLGLASTLALAGAGAAIGQGSSLAMLDRLDRGNWDIRYRGGDGDPGNLCVATGREFIQLRHRQDRCSRVVVEDAPGEVVVQYTCPGKGYGRTSVRRETSGLVQIQSQGIENGLPFSFAAEARRSGGCRR
jgi:hypothetical protein